MTTESNVAIAPDNTDGSAHNIRTVTVYPTDGPVSVTHGEDQQVVTPAGADGTMVDVKGGAMSVQSPELALLLKALIRRLDLLNGMMDRTYIPPDDLG